MNDGELIVGADSNVGARITVKLTITIYDILYAQLEILGTMATNLSTTYRALSMLFQVLRCSVLQYVAVCCRVLQCDAVCCSVLQCVAVCCNVLQGVTYRVLSMLLQLLCCAVLYCWYSVAVCCSVLQCVAVCCSV